MSKNQVQARIHLGRGEENKEREHAWARLAERNISDREMKLTATTGPMSKLTRLAHRIAELSEKYPDEVDRHIQEILELDASEPLDEEDSKFIQLNLMQGLSKSKAAEKAYGQPYRGYVIVKAKRALYQFARQNLPDKDK